MSEALFSNAAYDITLWVYAAATLATLLGLLFVVAPYGRHARKGFGPAVDAQAAWAVMEGVALVVMPLVFLAAAPEVPPAAAVLAFLWCAHYFNRAVIYPWRRRGAGGRSPLLIPLLAVLFNVLNGYANGLGLAANLDRYDASWLSDPRFIIGVALFFIGAGINIHSDAVLLRLRKEKGPGYHMPQRGVHKHVAAPNYFGEILEWVGWAIAAWTAAGFLFAAYTAANLAPRAYDHLKWYRARFQDYPKTRKALIPFVW